MKFINYGKEKLFLDKSKTLVIGYKRSSDYDTSCDECFFDHNNCQSGRVKFFGSSSIPYCLCSYHFELIKDGV